MTPRRGPAVNATGAMVVGAERADLDVVSGVIADAFHPLAVSQWLIPDPDARRQVFPGYFRIYAEHAMATGKVLTTSDRDAVALWLPVGENGPSPPDNYDERLAAATGAWNSRFVALDEAFEKHHPVGAPHQHLAILAVRPDRQGAGIGTALLDWHHAALDEAALPAYLEASALDTREIYLRHGYADYGGPIRLPGGPMMYPMMRQPRGARMP